MEKTKLSGWEQPVLVEPMNDLSRKISEAPLLRDSAVRYSAKKAVDIVGSVL